MRIVHSVLPRTPSGVSLLISDGEKFPHAAKCVAWAKLQCAQGILESHKRIAHTLTGKARGLRWHMCCSLRRQAAFNVAIAGWIPCGVIFACIALSLGKEEDALQVCLLLPPGNLEHLANAVLPRLKFGCWRIWESPMPSEVLRVISIVIDEESCTAASHAKRVSLLLYGQGIRTSGKVLSLCGSKLKQLLELLSCVGQVRLRNKVSLTTVRILDREDALTPSRLDRRETGGPQTPRHTPRPPSRGEYQLAALNGRIN